MATHRMTFPRPAIGAGPRTAIGAGLLAAGLLLAGLPGHAAGPADGEARVAALTSRIAQLESGVARVRTAIPGAAKSRPIKIAQTQVAQGSALAQMELRVAALERELRDLTGKVEDLRFETRTLKDLVTRLQSDTDYRLTELEGGKPKPRQSAGNSGGNAGGGSAPPRSATRSNPNPATGSGGNAGGTNTGGGQVATKAPPGVTLPEGSPVEQYRYATGFLRTGNFGEAEGYLRAFLAKHNGHPLAGNAQYWLGETYYVRGRYEDAAVAFADGFQQYPKSVKAPDNLLKLGMSLSRLNKRREACTAFGEITKRYPKASSAVKQAASSERSRLGC